jgi:hypothetical protein
MHDEAAVHHDDWETFFHIRNYLMQCHFWMTHKDGKKMINWKLFLKFLV